MRAKKAYYEQNATTFGAYDEKTLLEYTVYGLPMAAIRTPTTGLGAAIIVVGHNEGFSLQTNLNNLGNLAFRTFRSAGFSDTDIQYLAPEALYPYGDGVNRVDAPATVANVQAAIENWASQSGRVGPDKPLHLYMVDHGLVEVFCADGCASGGQITPAALNTWLGALEASTGANQINLIIEMSHAGSFMDRTGDLAQSVSKSGRVVITSTDRDHNAYASATGAYFSDALFACIAAGYNLRACHEQAKAAVAVMQVLQYPWLDDNGDGVSNTNDGLVAVNRYVGNPGAYEPDNTCGYATVIAPGGVAQTHLFEEPGDQDWVKFTAPAKATYILEVSNAGADADPVASVYDACSMAQIPLDSEDNPLGPSFRLEWDASAGVTYWIKLMQREPSVTGTGTNYDLTLLQDLTAPAAPKNLRCATLNQTTLSMQWSQSPERDVVGYEVHYQQQGGGQSGAPIISGRGNTYIEIPYLSAGSWYDLWAKAIDYSNNKSDNSATVACRVVIPTDATIPLLNLQAPVASGTYSTTLSAVTFGGTAQDAGSNLSRVKVYNATTGGDSYWDYGLSGSLHSFRIENVGLAHGDNLIGVTAYDSANNPSLRDCDHGEACGTDPGCSDHRRWAQ